MEFKEIKNQRRQGITCKVAPNKHHNTQIQGVVIINCVINAIRRSFPRLHYIFKGERLCAQYI
jgi:hypothetical protein